MASNTMKGTPPNKDTKKVTTAKNIMNNTVEPMSTVDTDASSGRGTGQTGVNCDHSLARRPRKRTSRCHLRPGTRNRTNRCQLRPSTGTVPCANHIGRGSACEAMSTATGNAKPESKAPTRHAAWEPCAQKARHRMPMARKVPSPRFKAHNPLRNESTGPGTNSSANLSFVVKYPPRVI